MLNHIHKLLFNETCYIISFLCKSENTKLSIVDNKILRFDPMEAVKIFKGGDSMDYIVQCRVMNPHQYPF